MPGKIRYLNVAFTPNDATDYTSASDRVTINVLKATPQISWSNPADIVYGTALGATQLDASAEVGGSITYTLADGKTSANGAVLNAGPNQTLNVLFTPNDATDYTTATDSVVINVLKATPQITWSNPGDIVYGTALGAAQLDASADVGGTFSYTLADGTTAAAGAVLSAGANQVLKVMFTPTDKADYASANDGVVINVLKATPNLSWSNPTDIVYGTPLGSMQLDASANVDGSFDYTLANGTTPANGAVLHAGPNQLLNVAFTPIDTNDYTTNTDSALINVLKAVPTISWVNPSFIVAGTPLGAMQLDATPSVPGTLSYTLADGTTAASGAKLSAGIGQPLNVLFTPSDATDYQTATASAAIDVVASSHFAVTASWMEGLQFTNATKSSFGAILQAATSNGPGDYDAFSGAPVYEVDPYFADLAVYSLLQTQAPDSLQTAARWISWYLGHLNSNDTIDNYWYTVDGTPGTPKLDPNSVIADADDSNGATFLAVVNEYYLAGGSTAYLQSPSVETAIQGIAAMLASLQQGNGLTWTYLQLPASKPGQVEYLEDNAEAEAGLAAFAELEGSLYQQSAAAGQYANAAARVAAGIANVFYDPAAGTSQGLYDWADAVGAAGADTGTSQSGQLVSGHAGPGLAVYLWCFESIIGAGTDDHAARRRAVERRVQLGDDAKHVGIDGLFRTAERRYEPGPTASRDAVPEPIHGRGAHDDGGRRRLAAAQHQHRERRLSDERRANNAGLANDDEFHRDVVGSRLCRRSRRRELRCLCFRQRRPADALARADDANVRDIHGPGRTYLHLLRRGHGRAR